jgi:DNA gyrase subunit A
MPKKTKKKGDDKPKKKKIVKKEAKKTAKKVAKKTTKKVKKEIKEELKEEPEILEAPDSGDSGDEGEESVIAEGSLDGRDIVDEMESSYLNYAMSVIVSRALPDVRDGLKPVHRRVLYAMHDTGLTSGAKFKKSATVVGEVIGKYHPHGDQAVYDTLVRLAQDFSMRYPLVNGQGNFGSIDGDSAAAMRYTEAKMTKLADEMLADINKETVDFQPNYDGNHMEPKVLPSRVPQLLLNGTVGIAVGMATNIPPHNLVEVIDGTIHLIDNPDVTVEELMEFIKGPDFPTSGVVYDENAIREMYATGRGGVVMRAVANIEDVTGGKNRIIISEIPYQVNKANLIVKIADLVQSKRIQGISDIRDESTLDEPVRIVVELKRDSYPKKILNQLFKLTPMQCTFNMNMIALVDGIQPHLLNLKSCLEHFVVHRQEVITRRTKFELKVAKARAHILEGLKKALDHIDQIIKTIKASKDKDDAKKNLMKKFKFTDVQAAAILEMPLRTLAGLERKKIEDELKEKRELIKYLESLLADPKKILGVIKDELVEMKEKYGSDRRTKIVPHAVGEFSALDTIPDEPMVVALSREGYIKRVSPTSFRTQRRGGKGIIGATTKEEDEITHLVYTSNHKFMLFFTNLGRVFRLPVYELPQASRTAKGQAVINFLQLQPQEKVSTVISVESKLPTGEYFLMGTRKGYVKKTMISDFQNVRKSGLIAIKIREGDSLEWVRSVSKGGQVMIVTQEGKGIRFNEDEVRPMGRASQGVRGIRLKGDDKVVEMNIVQDAGHQRIMVLMENGMGKSTPVSEYRLQARGGTGVKTANVTNKTGRVVGAKMLDGIEGDLIIISRKGQTIRLATTDIPTQGRATQGVYLMRLASDDRVASISLIASPESQEKELKEGDTKKVSVEPKAEEIQEEPEEAPEEEKETVPAP